MKVNHDYLIRRWELWLFEFAAASTLKILIWKHVTHRLARKTQSRYYGRGANVSEVASRDKGEKQGKLLAMLQLLTHAFSPITDPAPSNIKKRTLLIFFGPCRSKSTALVAYGNR